MSAAASNAGLPKSAVELVGIRASQINGCTVCLDMHIRGAEKAAETDERLAALALAEAARHYDEQALAALIVSITAINMRNRLNVLTGQVAGEWTAERAG